MSSVNRGPLDLEALAPLGFDAFFAQAAACRPDHPVARVVCAHRDAYDLSVSLDTPSFRAVLPGAWRRRETPPSALPGVGDFVHYSPAEGDGPARIEHVLPRRSLFQRRAAGGAEHAQVVAANVDTVLLVSGLDGDLNVRRLHRYLAQLHESGAAPVLVLNKADDDLAAEIGRAQLHALGGRWPVVAVSALHGRGLAALDPYLAAGRTLALVGSSGVGKSTLANRLAGRERQETGAVRDRDARGQHTTTRRELFALPGGALLLDTPGMRSLGLWDAETGVDALFDDVTALAAECRFTDCQHDREPGCAVRAAIENGDVSPERAAEWAALRREAAFEARKADPALAAAHRRLWKSRTKAIRAGGFDAD